MARKLVAADDLQDDFDLDGSLVEESYDGSDVPETESAATETRKRSREQKPTTQIADKSADVQKKKRKKNKKTDTTTSTTASKFVTPQALEDQAKLWNKYMAKAYPSLGELELSDIALLPAHMYTTKEPIHGSSSYLEDLARTAVTAKGKNKVTYGAPQLLVLCSSALRVLELVKRLRPLSQRATLKLFSRHIKIGEHKTQLKSTAVDIAVGTPNRVRKLMEEGDLKVNRLKLVVIDCWQDNKMRVLIDMDDTRSDLFAIWRDILLPASKNPDYSFKLRLV
ncbi:cms1 ribosomal small subunit [Coemansia guatemalensis]|uniref:Cms1 ribosomal small subunit n=1 Tax=Coemansia guatemalensis TaxID=2761395 RepID=A0A9W8LW23_9FUNG|nr:cms1 ribosomal small subunit [Coemansia guatemalensis]